MLCASARSIDAFPSPTHKHTIAGVNVLQTSDAPAVRRLRLFLEVSGCAPRAAEAPAAAAYTVVVGQKPSRAPLYLNDPADVVTLLGRLAGMPAAPRPPSQ